VRARPLGGRARPLGLELVLLALVLALAAVLFTQGLGVPADYDEGSYLAAVDALRHGQALGTDVFAPQPPGFYSLLVAGDSVLGNSLDAVRVEVVLLALLGCVGAYLVGRVVAGRWAGVAAAALLAVAHPYASFAGRISADLPALALALLALAAFLAATRGTRAADALATAAGTLWLLSVLVKVSSLTLLVPLVGYACARRLPLRRIGLGLAGAGIVVGGFLLAYRNGLHGIWRGAVSYHAAARDVRSPGTSVTDNLRHYQHFFDLRTRNAVVWIAPLGLLAWLALPRDRPRLPLWPLWTWAVVCFGFLVWHRPLHDNHDVLLAGALAAAAGTAVGAALSLMPRREAVAGAALIAAVLTMSYVKQIRDLHGAHAREPAEVRWAVRQLRARTTTDQLVAADRPIIAFLADRRMPGDLVDTAYLRFRAGYLTDRQVLRDLDRQRVAAVVTARAFRDRPAIVAGLRRRFRVRARYRDVTVYARSRSRAPASSR
jgi:4-amino-4-deoxy-L-arabinose transferase-like glycosyltransferase